VITLTATGLLCYAGHVCNYYVKTLEWLRGLPAVLSDKRWFLIKRRRSIKNCAVELRQKKPTTANRHRLEAGIQEALKRLPNVFKDSYPLPAELAKFPTVGEREILEQHDDIQLHGGVSLTRDAFSHWMDSGARSAEEFPCAVVVMRYAIDQQGVDLRGGVASDTAWELCCRLLSAAADCGVLGSAEVAQLLVYWLDEGHVPRQMQKAVYDGMEADLLARGETVQTEADEQSMKVRWVKQLTHGKLDAVRQKCAAGGEDLPVEFDVEGGLIKGEPESATIEA